MRIVVVEDEATILTGLINLIRRISPSYEIVATADNGEDGLEKICEYKPALVIADIVMPGMNGIEMIEQAKRRGVSAEYVLLSGHNDFSFAQRAIGLGVREYLLKPFTRSAIEALLEKVELIIAQKSASFNADAFVMTARERSLYLQIQNGVSGMPVQGPVWPVMIGFKTPVMPEYVECIRQTFRVYNMFNHMDLCLLPAQDPCCIHALAFNTDTDLAPDMHMHMNHTAMALLRACGDIAIILLHPETDCANLPAACGTLEKLSSWRIQLAGRDGNRVYWTDQLPMQAISSITGLMQIANNACASLLVHDFASASSAIDSILEALNSAFYRCDQLQQILTFIATSLQSACDESASGISTPWVAQIESCAYAPDLLLSMRETIETLRTHYEKLHGSHPLIARIFDLSHQNYAQPLNLDILAQQINISPKYLGQLFIDETGMKYSQYLHSLRIQKAQALLSQTGLSIASIANKVGFSDEKYFQRIFKEKVGMSPGSYARKHRKQPSSSDASSPDDGN